jgi:uncharacterized membrane protein (DUF485 family)
LSTTANFQLTTIEWMINEEQNSGRQLRRLEAQRQLYATAKSILGWQLFFGGPIAVLSAFATLAFPQLKGVAAAWGVLITLSDLFWLTPWQKRLRNEAASIQESFDCDVLRLPWNDLKAGKQPDPELVKEQSHRYKVRASSMPPLANWYAPAVNELPLHLGRIACQRSNCWWDSKQRRRYAVLLIAMVVLTFLAVLAVAFGKGFTLEDLLLKVGAPLMPMLVLGIRQFNEQMEAAKRLDKLKEHAEHLWEDSLSGAPEAEITARSRNLQDEILENRRKSPLVFDFIFKRLRPNYDVQMNFGVDELVTEAKERLGLK